MKYFFVGFIAVFVWEFGHPYIPGFVPSHDHIHECA